MAKSSQTKFIDRYLFPILFLTIFLVSLVRLESTPPLWWDEGWTLTAAKNWVEIGHYGQIQNGQFWSTGLSGAFPIIAPVALSFKLLGIGVWQARLVGVCFTIASLIILIYYFVRRLYNRSIALGTLFVLLFMPVHPRVNPVLNGRQVLADMPMLCYLLLGFVFLDLGLRRSKGYLPFSMLFMGIAINAKAQTLPFLLVAISLPICFAVFKRNWRTLVYLGVVGVGSIVISRVWLVLQAYLLRAHTGPSMPIRGLTQIVALVLDPKVRLSAGLMFMVAGIPIFIGLIDATGKLYREVLRKGVEGENDTIIKLAFYGFSGSWFAWFVLLSNGGDRYLLAPYVIGAMFFADFLYTISGGYHFFELIKTSIHELSLSFSTVYKFSSLIFLLAFFTLVIGGTGYYYYFTFNNGNKAALEVANYINSSTPQNALIESYESELFFFLKRPYHYPPDQVHVDLLRRSLVEPSLAIHYDPIEVNPDYLVLGAANANWHLYDQLIDTGSFVLLRTIGPYKIYERNK